MKPELYIVIGICTVAAAFIGWRVWQTLRVARGDKGCDAGCGCDKGAKARKTA